MPKAKQLGRPPLEIREVHVLSLAAQDLSVEGVAKMLGVSKTTLYEHFPNGKLKELMEEGQRDGVNKLLNLEWRAAIAGDGKARRFLLSKRHPKYAVQRVQIQGEVNHTHTHVHLMSLTREERLQRIAKLREELQLPPGTIIDAVQEKSNGQRSRSKKLSNRNARSSRKGGGASSSGEREGSEAHA